MVTPTPAKEFIVDPLTRLSIRFGADKFGTHQYTPAYHRILKHLRDQPINLLEIGVGGYNNPQSGGASLRMWAGYFPNARIVGLDIAPKSIDISPRITIVHGSQVDDATLDSLTTTFGPFDVIVDDGSHVPAHMIYSFRRLYPRMREDGIYIIEDTQTCFHRDLNAVGTIYEFAQKLILQMHHNEGYRATQTDADLSSFAEITSAVSFQRNFVTFLRGRNDYPSPHRLDLSHEMYARVLNTINQEATNNPSARNVLCRIEMCIWAGQLKRADALAQQAMQATPNDLSIMYELLRLMKWANREERFNAVKERIVAISGKLIETP